MRKLIMTVIPLLMCTVASAQVTGSRNYIPLSFEEALSITMSDNPQITAAKFEQKAAMHERKAAWGLRLPQIGVTGAYAHLGKDIDIDLNHIRDGAGSLFQGAIGDLNLSPGIIAAGQSLFQREWTIRLLDQDIVTLGGTVKMPLFTGGKINAANRAAKINEQTAIVKGHLVKAELLTELVERYYGLLLANHAVIVRQQVVYAMKAHLEDAIQLESNGVIPKSERLYMEVKFAEAERDLLDARSQATTIAAALNNTLNMEREVLPVSEMFILSEVPTLYSFKEMAMANNHLLKQVDLKRELAVQGMKAQRGEFMPQVAALGGANVYNNNSRDLLPSWFVGVGVQFKIFDASRGQKYSASKNTVRQVESIQDKAQKDITLLVENLYNELMTYSDKMPSIEKTLEFATEYLRVKNSGFKEGVSTAVDVIDAELNLAKTRIEKLQTAYSYDLTLAKLLEAAGTSERFVSYAKGSEAMPVKYE